MDLSDIHKIANRKRLSADAEKLREKISRETKNIIKLKVQQDTAYWDLREQLSQVVGNHEKLQANMVDVQMQHEAISGQYQDELRLRPETLNKLSSTREICDVLEDYSERLRATLSRCQADQASLYDAYQRSGRLVRDMKTQQVHAGEKSQTLVESLQEKVKMSSEHYGQLLQLLTSEKQRAAAAVAELEAALTTARGQKGQLAADLAFNARQIEGLQVELKKKEEALSSLQNDVERLLQERQTRQQQLQVQQQNYSIKDQEVTALKQAITNQEAFNKTICEKNDELQEKLVALEEEYDKKIHLIGELNAKIEEGVAANDGLKVELTAAVNDIDALKKEILDKIEVITKAEEAIQDLKTKLISVEGEKENTGAKLKECETELNSVVGKVEELAVIEAELRKNVGEVEAALKEYKTKADQKVKELNETIQQKDKEIEYKVGTINQLMDEVKNSADQSDRLQGDLLRAQKEMAIERDAAKEKERTMVARIEELNNSGREKDEELNKQMNIIRELMNDKEKLQSRIEYMQTKIDNVQKELNGREPPRRLQAEPDDNAVMLTPQQKPPRAEQPELDAEFAVPRHPKPIDSLALNFLSDSSLDGDNTLDPMEVNRRFEAYARGERMSPLPLAAMKRRRSGVPAAQGGLRLKVAKNDAMTSLSQVKTDIGKERSFFKNKRHDKTKK